MPAKVIKIHSTIIIKGALVSNAHWKNSISVFFFHPHLRNANVNPWRWRYSKRHASASPSDAHGNKILKAPNMRGSLSAEEPPSQNISATKEGKKIHTHTHTNQLKDCTKSGLSLLRDRCRITSMRNLTMTLPPPPPPKQSLPLPPNYYQTLKPTSVTLKLKSRDVEGGAGFMGFVLIRSCIEDFGLFLKAKRNQFSLFLHMRLNGVWEQQAWRIGVGVFYTGRRMGGVCVG